MQHATQLFDLVAPRTPKCKKITLSRYISEIQNSSLLILRLTLV